MIEEETINVRLINIHYAESIDKEIREIAEIINARTIWKEIKKLSKEEK